MYDKVQSKVEDSGVSPVIGVILMVAVTVALVALVTVIVFDIGGDVSESPDATVDIEATSDGAGTGSVTATVLRNENVDSFTFKEQGSGTATYDMTGSEAEAGGSATLDTTVADGDQSSNALSSSGTVQVIATMSDGSSQVLTTSDFDFN